jgi:hypothetical protein
MRIAVGMIRPDDGEIVVDGELRYSSSVRDAAAAGSSWSTSIYRWCPALAKLVI